MCLIWEHVNVNRKWEIKLFYLPMMHNTVALKEYWNVH
jgi:hypothetical protein